MVLSSADAARVAVRDLGPATRAATIEFRGVGAGRFDPKLWLDGRLNLVSDVRRPLIEPKEGNYRNIYAPSVMKTAAGWIVFYGGWDGTVTGNDRIYRAKCDGEFLGFSDRHTVIEHGGFEHVCNVNVTRDERGGWAMMATAYPDAAGRNKPIAFFSPDGEHWNGETTPHVA